MCRTFDHDQNDDRAWRHYQALNPTQQASFVRRHIHEARVARAVGFRVVLRQVRRCLCKAMALSIAGLRRAGVGIGGLIVTAWRAYQRRRQRRLASLRLHAMDDRMLKDIGLRRGEIDFVLSGVEDPTRRPRPPRAQTSIPIADARPRVENPVQRDDEWFLLRKACAG